MIKSACQIAIIGGGPSGLSAAIQLKQLGAAQVIIIERESQAGGIPRHCGHSIFGMREFHRVLSGKNYAKQLVKQAISLGVEIWLGTTVTKCESKGMLTLSNAQGMQALKAEKIIICTGNRETPRAPRLISGTRPMGIVTTGALQSMVYLKGRRPFRRPVIIGTELIAFSALLTCRHAGIKPAAMIESNHRTTFHKTASMLPRMLGIALHLNTSVNSIHGKDRVSAIEVTDHSGSSKLIDCDGVIFSGQFISESSLIQSSHLQLDQRSGGPLIDQYNRCSDPDYFACGNMLHPVDTAGWCWSQGKKVAGYVWDEINGLIPKTHRYINIESNDGSIKYFTPQKIAMSSNDMIQTPTARQQFALQIRFNSNQKGQLSLSDEKQPLSKKAIKAVREKRQLLVLPDYGRIGNSEKLMLKFTV